MRAHLASLDESGVAALVALLSPLLALGTAGSGAGWRATWPCLLLILTALPVVPLHVEARYLWPAESALLGALGLLWTRFAHRGTLLGILLGAVLFVPPLVMAAVQLAVRFVAPARHELRIARSWAEDVRAAGATGPVASWTPHPDKALDPEGLYLAWRLGEPWLAHLGGPEDLPRAAALGARVLVLKTRPAESAPPSWIRDDPRWRLLVTTEARKVTFRDGWYFLFVRGD